MVTGDVGMIDVEVGQNVRVEKKNRKVLISRICRSVRLSHDFAFPDKHCRT